MELTSRERLGHIEKERFRGKEGTKEKSVKVTEEGGWPCLLNHFQSHQHQSHNSFLFIYPMSICTRLLIPATEKHGRGRVTALHKGNNMCTALMTQTWPLTKKSLHLGIYDQFILDIVLKYALLYSISNIYIYSQQKISPEPPL